MIFYAVYVLTKKIMYAIMVITIKAYKVKYACVVVLLK